MKNKKNVKAQNDYEVPEDHRCSLLLLLLFLTLIRKRMSFFFLFF